MKLQLTPTSSTSLPRFQQTRGVLRDVGAVGIKGIHGRGHKGPDHKDLLIGMGNGRRREDSMFRAALFEQLGESRLEGARYHGHLWQE